jgi:hypothetical protein
MGRRPGCRRFSGMAPQLAAAVGAIFLVRWGAAGDSGASSSGATLRIDGRNLLDSSGTSPTALTTT